MIELLQYWRCDVLLPGTSKTSNFNFYTETVDDWPLCEYATSYKFPFYHILSKVFLAYQYQDSLEVSVALELFHYSLDSKIKSRTQCHKTHILH